jgi:hypothetical protein
MRRREFLFLFPVASAAAQNKYTGPRPPKPDLPYLLHAANLVPTEAKVATEETRKDWQVYSIEGEQSPARTPLAEPIFLIAAEKLQVEKLQLYKLEQKPGRREIAFPSNPKRRKDAPEPLHLSFSRLEPGLYRVEANEMLENGEYSLTPSGSNDVFCFQVY